MTTEEAIRILKNSAFLATVSDYQSIEEATNMAIEALKEKEMLKKYPLSPLLEELYEEDACNKYEPSAQSESTRTFVELVVEYPDPEICTYKEYKGKPYFSIKYIENGEEHVGYGTYNPEVLSQYLKEDFISSVQPEKPFNLPEIYIAEGYDTIEGEDGNVGFGVYVPDENQIYVAGDVEGEIRARALLHEICHWVQAMCGRPFDEDEANEFSNTVYDALPSAQPEQRWIPVDYQNNSPEENKVVLLGVRFRDNFKYFVTSRQDYNYWTGLGREIRGELKWQPLPEPYQKENER